MAARVKLTLAATFALLAAVGLPGPVPEHRFHRRRGWRFDWAWPRQRVALEVDGGVWLPGGGRHNRGAGFSEDLRKLNEAALLGWLVLRATPRMVESGEALAWLRRALAKGR